MTSAEHGGTWGSPHYDALKAEIAGLRAQLEDLRRSKTVAALGRVAGDASALLYAMSAADEIRAADEFFAVEDGGDGPDRLGPVAFGELRDNLAGALRSFTDAAEADLAAAGKRAVGLQNGPLTDELVAEKATEDAGCPECHGFGLKATRRPGSCPRCKGSGQIDPFDFGIRTATVARGRDAS